MTFFNSQTTYIYLLILSMLFIAKNIESVKIKFSGLIYANCPLILCNPELACSLTCELICEKFEVL